MFCSGSPAGAWLPRLAEDMPAHLADCTCAHTLINNNVCDDACFNNECNWDGADCLLFGPNSGLECSEGCLVDFVGDGECDVHCNNTDCSFDLSDCLPGPLEQCEAVCPSAARRISAGECEADCDGEAIPEGCFALADQCDDIAVRWYRFHWVLAASLVATILYVAAVLELIRRYALNPPLYV